MPQLQHYFADDVIPVLEAQRANYDKVTSVSNINFIGWLVLGIGVIVIVYGLLMVAFAAFAPTGRSESGARGEPLGVTVGREPI